MATVPNTVKDISRAIAVLDEMATDPEAGVSDGHLTRVAANLAYVMGKNVALGKITGSEVAYVLASHGFTGDLRHYGRIIARRIHALRFEYGTISPQI